MTCEHCNDEQVVDSGGVTPWGEGIWIPCGHCVAREIIDTLWIESYWERYEKEKGW